MLKKRSFYLLGLITLALGFWLFAMLFTGLLNPGSLLVAAIAVALIAFPLAPAIRRISHRVWVTLGLITLAGLTLPPAFYTKFFPKGDAEPYSLSIALTNLFLILTALILTALLINSILNLEPGNRHPHGAENESLPALPKRPLAAAAGMLLLSAGLLAKAFHSFYWFMIWDSTTDPLSWLWLPVPILAVFFSSFLLFSLLPKKRKLAGFLYLAVIPALMAVFAFTQKVDFRQLTAERAVYVSHLVESYKTRVGRYPQDLQQLQSSHLLSIPGPVILYGENWCYEGGDDYFRLGYVNRRHWSDPRLTGKVYASNGEVPPDITGMCQAEITAIQKRYPDYPYEYWRPAE